MRKNWLLRSVVSSLLVLILFSDGFADIRIRFARGRTSATVSGSISAGGRVCYVAGARSGQTLNAVISSTSGKAMIFESGETSYSLNVERSGDQSVCVDNIGKATRYSLTVSIL
ncbi:MAG: hypothetical protein KA746_14850 [Pyrinomonadaceae bacterium]|nr:hypothetical protein [Pyrinomonadaceae bacterium]